MHLTFGETSAMDRGIHNFFEDADRKDKKRVYDLQMPSFIQASDQYSLGPSKY